MQQACYFARKLDPGDLNPKLNPTTTKSRNSLQGNPCNTPSSHGDGSFHWTKGPQHPEPKDLNAQARTRLTRPLTDSALTQSLKVQSPSKKF